MPFKSEKQRRYLWAKHPEIARRWTRKYGSFVPPGASNVRRKRKRSKT